MVGLIDILRKQPSLMVNDPPLTDIQILNDFNTYFITAASEVTIK